MTHVLLVAIGVIVAVFVLVLVGQLGKVLLERDPHSVWGERFTIIGIAARRSVRILAAKYPVARAIADSLPDSDPPPPPKQLRPPPPLLMLCLVLAGCTDLRPAVAVVNGARTAGHAYAAVVERVCTVPAERAATLPEAEARAEVDRLYALGCPAALHAQTDVAHAHEAMHDLLVAIQAGQCVATLARDVPPSCDWQRAAAELADAGARLGAAVERLERAR